MQKRTVIDKVMIFLLLTFDGMKFIENDRSNDGQLKNKKLKKYRSLDI